jgi:hypothetical protein
MRLLLLACYFVDLLKLSLFVFFFCIQSLSMHFVIGIFLEVLVQVYINIVIMEFRKQARVWQIDGRLSKVIIILVNVGCFFIDKHVVLFFSILRQLFVNFLYGGLPHDIFTYPFTFIL